jgi:trehalose 2-sulfotransferase
VTPQVSYLVCATQRSGSTLLCAALKETGVAGVPEEYFEARPATGRPPRPADYLQGLDDPAVHALVADAPEPPAPPYSSLAGVTRWRDHLERVLRAGRTPNGVFGAKVMWNQLADLQELTAGDEQAAPHDPLELLRALVAPTHWIWVRRRDVIGQAVSLWRALQTQAWRDDRTVACVARYSRPAIAHLVALLQSQDTAWKRLFADGGVAPLELVYEQFASDLRGGVAAVLAHLGLPAPPDVRSAGEPPLRRQADRLSEAWAAAYRAGADAPPALQGSTI